MADINRRLSGMLVNSVGVLDDLVAPQRGAKKERQRGDGLIDIRYAGTARRRQILEGATRESARSIGRNASRVSALWVSWLFNLAFLEVVIFFAAFWEAG